MHGPVKILKKVREKSRKCHNHKPQPFPDTKRKRKPTNPNKHKSNKRTKSTKIGSLFPKRGNRNAKRIEKHKNKTTQGKAQNKSPHRTKQQRVRQHRDYRLRTVSRVNHRGWRGWRAGGGGGGAEVETLLQLANFTLGPDATLNTEIHKISVRLKAPNSVNASKRKHKNQINHYNKQRRVLMANSTVCQSKWKSIVEPQRAKPKTYRQAPTHCDKVLRRSRHWVWGPNRRRGI